MISQQNIQPYNCPFCDDNSYTEIKTFKDKVVVGKCSGCGLTYTPKRHDTPDDLFGDVSMDQLYTLYKPIIEGKKRHFRDKIFRKYLKKVSRFSKGTKHLDIGCAHGFFMNITKKEGYDVTGVEPNRGMAEFGKIFLGVDIHHGTLDKIDLTKKWDIVTFTDSLEYFMTPLSDLTQLVTKNLNNQGVVFIKVPNGDYFFARHFLKKIGLSLGNAEAYSPSKRVAHYNDKTLEQLVKKAGLEPLKIGYFLPIHSPVWYKYIGIHIEIENPWWMGVKERLVRNVFHFFGVVQYTIMKKNHFSQSVYVIAKKN